MVMTLVFPDSLSNTFPRTAPLAHEVSIPDNSSVESLPPTWNPLSPVSQDTTLAFAVPFNEASDFLASVQELPNIAISDKTQGDRNEGVTPEPKSWVMKAAKNSGHATRRTMHRSAANFWTGFVDLIKVTYMLPTNEHSIAKQT